MCSPDSARELVWLEEQEQEAIKAAEKAERKAARAERRAKKAGLAARETGDRVRPAITSHVFRET
jgi:hypothetical protein